ncbi:hypothetical protein D3C86_2162260 [compost metagenome]
MTGFAVVLLLVVVHFAKRFEKLILNFTIVVFECQFRFSEAFFKLLHYQPRNVEMDLLMA